MGNLSGVVHQLRQERDRAQQAVERIDQALAALGGQTSSGHRRTMSVASRKAISIAQKSRWAKIKTNLKKPSASVGPRRTLSAAARRKIALAQKARWAAWKAKQKKVA